MDITELLSQIDRSETYPKMLSMTLETNALYLKINTTDWTEQMLAELPSIQFDVYTNTNGTYIKYKTVTVCLDTDICNGNYAVEIKDVPNDSYLAVTPMFDNNAIESHNNLVSTGIIDSDMWDTETSSFDISISYGAEEGASPTPPTPPSPLPEGYTEAESIEFLTTSDPFSIPMSGELEYVTTMSFTDPQPSQVLGYYLAANAYFGINIDSDIAAEWSQTGGITDKDPSDVNTIHLVFENGKRSELTIEGSSETSYGYGSSVVDDYSQYSSFYLNSCGGSSVVPVTIYNADFKSLSGTSIAKLYPCQRDSDNAVGMYDIVSKTFYPIPTAVLHFHVVAP